MNQKPQATRPITYFIVSPETFQAVANKLSTLPYQEVAGLMQDVAGSRAMFGPVPGEAPAPAPPPIPNVDEPPKVPRAAKPNGTDSDPPVANPASEPAAEPAAAAPDLDKQKPGGAE